MPEGYESFGDVGELSRLGIDALLAEVGKIASGKGGEVLSFFLMLFGVTLLLSLTAMVAQPIRQAVSGGVAAAACMAVFGAMYPLFTSVTEALGAMSGFFAALVPVLTSFLALGGGTGTALGAASGLNITVWLTGLISGKLLTTVMTAVFAICAVSSVLGGASERVAGSIKRIFTRAIGIVGAVVAAVFALQTYISVSADSVGMRAAKYAAGGLIPVVGGAVSGALSTLTGGLSALGGIIGASSVGVIVAMALSPLVLLLLYRLAFYLCSLFIEFTGGGSSCISAFSGALDTLISVYIMTTIIYIFEIILLIWGGNSIFGA